MIIIKVGSNRFNFSHYKQVVLRHNGDKSSINLNPAIASALSTNIVSGTEPEMERMMEAFDMAIEEKRCLVDFEAARDTPVTAAVVEDPPPAEFFDTSKQQPQTKGKKATARSRNVQKKSSTQKN